MSDQAASVGRPEIRYRITLPATLAFIITMLCIYLIGQPSFRYAQTSQGDRVDVTSPPVENRGG